MAIDEKKLIEDVEKLKKIDEIELARCLGFMFGNETTATIRIKERIHAFKTILNTINVQPKLLLETKTSDKWIPCSERPPEENGSYIVTSMDYVDTFEAVFDSGEWFSIEYWDDIKNVIAWMPLPEPYKGE